MASIQSKYIPNWVSRAPAGHSEFVLEQMDASTSERRTFDKNSVLFGRVEKVCDIVVSHVSASRVHACVGFDDTGKLSLGDLGSTHGMTPLSVCLRASAYDSSLLVRELQQHLLATSKAEISCLGKHSKLE